MMKSGILVCACFMLVSAAHSMAAKVYWTEIGGVNSDVMSSDPDGSNVQLVLDNVGGLPTDIEIDAASGKMYWANVEYGTISRANLDGSHVETVRTGLSRPYLMELSPQNDSIYFMAEHNGGDLYRVNMDGTGPIDVIYDTPDGADGGGVGIDNVNGKVYWSSRSGGYIMRANLDGTERETFATLSGGASGLEVDAVSGRVYWLGMIDGQRKVQSASIDGTGLTTLFTEADGLLYGFDLELSPSGDQLYCTSASTSLLVVNADGTGTVDTITSSGTDIRGVAYIPEPATMALLALGGLAGLRRRKA